MIKKSLIAASLLLASTSAFAQSKYYVGVGINTGSGTQTRSYASGGEYETEYDASSTNIKFGLIKPSGNRLEFTIETIAADRTGGNAFVQNVNHSDTTSEYVGYNFDYLFVFNAEDSLKPYIDLGVGLYKNDEITGYSATTGEAETASGIALNLGAGLLYGVTDNIEVETAYKMKSISWNLENPDTSETINMIYLGVNLTF